MKPKPFPLIRNDDINFSSDIIMFTEILIYNLTVKGIRIIDLKSTSNLNDLNYYCIYIKILYGPIIKKLSVVFNKGSKKICSMIFDVIGSNNHKKFIVESIATKKFNSTFGLIVKNLNF